ncbi:MAG: metal-dependent transcriptional regulator [Thermodesulfovibrionales bacterium]|nr:metal-dependent transcriptional regulator [Thermodesulfovibrionales bacterium]
MEKTMVIDEYLETLWRMQENADLSIQRLKDEVADDFSVGILETLISEGLATISDDKKEIRLTDKGYKKATRIIRAHRLAERLLYDAMGMSKDFEKGACEFEHILTDELVNSICTMLGHPKECPHGLPIPPGECCNKDIKSIESSIVRLSDMKIGEKGRIAYISCGEDQEMHRLNSLQIRPGATIRLHQNFPTFVIECEGAKVAIDDDIARNVSVWKTQQKNAQKEDNDILEQPKKGILKRILGIR